MKTICRRGLLRNLASRNMGRPLPKISSSRRRLRRYIPSAAASSKISQPQKITDIVGAATQTAESVWRDLAAGSPAFDCNKGCARCCHQTVMVIVPEALFVKNHIKNTFDLPEIEAL
jgi:hypothetical protein